MTTTFNELVKANLSERQQLDDQAGSDENIQVVEESAKKPRFLSR